MNYNESQIESGIIIERAIDEIGLILTEVQRLNPTIEENQIRDFKKQWKEFFSSPNNIHPKDKIVDSEFVKQFYYLINRMNDKNKIKERIIEISNQTIEELKNLWSESQ